MWDTSDLLKLIDGHKQKSSSVHKHLSFSNKHDAAKPTCLLEQFDVFAKYHTKFDCHITEILLFGF